MFKRALVVGICLALGLAAAPAYAQKSKDPVGLHGLEMRVREGDKPDFNDMTKKWGVEALRDENTGYLVYVSETGSLTVLDPGKPVTPAPADQAPKKPRWLHGLGLKARKAGESEWKDAKKWGLEAFRDENTEALLFMTEAGNLTALAFPTPPAPPPEAKGPTWLHGLDLKVRKAGDSEWKDAKKFGVEAFRDENTGALLYISEVGAVSGSAPQGTLKPADQVKAPTWLNGLDLPVRKGGEAEFTKDTKRWGLEVFRDENDGYLVYVTETGAVSTLKPPKTINVDLKPKDPVRLHGLDLKVRKVGEADFKTAKKIGIEVYRDENTGCLIYISENGSIAVVPAK